MIFFSLISTALSCIFYGIIVTAVVMAILYAVLKALGKGIVQSPVFYVTGVILGILLIIQFSLMIGAMQAKDATDAAELYMNQLLEDASGIVGANDSQRVMDAVTDHFPIIGNFIDIADFSGHEVSNLAKSMHDSMNDYLNSYIWHRIWWTLGIILVACIIVTLFERRSYSRDSFTQNNNLSSSTGLQF